MDLISTSIMVGGTTREGHLNLMFIFTASRAEAQAHYRDTIEHPVPSSVLDEHLGETQLAEISRRSKGPIFAWGATPGPKNIKLWEEIKQGSETRRSDCAVSYRQHAFRAFFNVTGAVHDFELAEALWGHGTNDDNKDVTWEYMYFLDKLVTFNVYSRRVFYGHTGPLSDATTDDIRGIIESTTGVSLP